MQILRSVPYARADFVHDDEVVHIEDAATGKVYEVYLRHSDPADGGDLCVFIPRDICKGVVKEAKYVIIHLGQVKS